MDSQHQRGQLVSHPGFFGALAGLGNHLGGVIQRGDAIPLLGKMDCIQADAAPQV